MKINRTTNLISIAKFYEYDALRKINYFASHNRLFTWDEEKQNLLIDSIIKKFPISIVIFRQMNNDENGSISYDIVDGKQRLLTIKNFIENKFPISIYHDNFYQDKLYFQDLNRTKQLREIKKNFWQYSLYSECIITNSDNFIKEIFVRINK